MSSYLIDCILSRHPFSKLGCIWKRTEAPIYIAYQILWAHKYTSYYKLICEEFIIPLYWLIFLKEPNFLYDNVMEVISEYGDYYFSQEGTYIRMYGCSRAPSLFPKYAIDFVFHKEVFRKVFLNLGLATSYTKWRKQLFLHYLSVLEHINLWKLKEKRFCKGAKNIPFWRKDVYKKRQQGEGRWTLHNS